ncbi:Uncharacterised protein [Mycobacteroides abscessus subsp. abscessus]|nr:Uncharacterised protein [Mycobacteroides abscessus subsp. abscessus]
MRRTGAGSARRSSLPTGVNGISSSTVIAVGTMCAGSAAAACAISASMSISAPSAGTT